MSNEYFRKCGVMGGNVYLRYKGGCEKEDNIKNMYRCGGCGGWFHKDCLYKHFEEEKEHDYGRAELIKDIVLTGKVRVTWFHGTNNEKEFLEKGIYKRATEEYPNASDCIYLATTAEEARHYGDNVYEVYYNPLINLHKNNYSPESWQMRVYEPLDVSLIRKFENKEIE